jgi:hypothetical protein
MELFSPVFRPFNVNKLEYLALLITGKWVCSECSEQGINDEDLDENSEKKETESPIISGTNVMWDNHN